MTKKGISIYLVPEDERPLNFETYQVYRKQRHYVVNHETKRTKKKEKRPKHVHGENLRHIHLLTNFCKRKKNCMPRVPLRYLKYYGCISKRCSSKINQKK